MEKLLINSLEKFENIIPLTYTLDDAQLLPQSRISQQYIFKYVPESVQAILIDQDFQSISDDNERTLYERINGLVFNFIGNHIAYSLLPKLYSNITAAGMRVEETETHQRAPKWSYDEARNAYKKDCYVALWDMMDLLCSKNLISPNRKSVIWTYAHVADTTLRIDALTFHALKDSFFKHQENYLYPIVPKNIVDAINKNEIIGPFVDEFYSRARDLVLTATLYHNLFSMSIQLNSGTIASVPMLDNETMIQSAIPIAHLQELKNEWKQLLDNLQNSMGSFVLSHAFPFADTPYYLDNINAGILPDYNNAAGISFML